MAIFRHFLGWDTPGLPLAADFLVNRYAHDDQLDLSNVILVFPGRRAARRMLELLLERAEHQFPGLMPPRMVTFQTFPELLYVQKQQLADDLTQLLVWKKALTVVPKQKITTVISTLPGEDSLTAWMKLCETLRKQHDELAAEGLDFDDVYRMLAERGDRTEAERWAALRCIQLEYLRQMDALQLWDRQTARLFAVDENECHTDSDILLIGTVDMNGIVKKMLSQVSDRVTTLIHAPEEAEEEFDDFGCLIPERWKDRQIDVPDSMTSVVDGPGDQAAAVNDFLSAVNGQYRADDIAVALGDEALVPVIEQGLQAAGVAGRWPVESTVRASRPWRLLESVVAHLSTAQNGQPPDFVSMSDLVRHPDVGAFVQKHLESIKVDSPQWLAEFDRYLARHLQPYPGQLLGPSDRSTVVAGICHAVEALLTQLVPSDRRTVRSLKQKRPATRPELETRQQLLFTDASESEVKAVHSELMQRRPLTDWAHGCLRLLQVIYEDYETGLDTRRDDSMATGIESLTEFSEILQAIPSGIVPVCTAAQAIPVLLLQTADGNVPAPPNEAAIDLMGWLEVPLDDCPVVIVAGFNEGRIPQSATTDVFLPNSMRSQLGLTDNQRRYARDAWALETLLHNRSSVRFVAGRRDTEGDPLKPSRLWFAGDRSRIAKRVKEFYAGHSNEEEHSDDEFNAAQDESRSPGFIVPAPATALVVPEHISVTSFRDFIDCPYRYIMRRELRLQTEEDRPHELDGRAFGNLVHTVLSQFAETDYIHATQPETVTEVLLDLFWKAATREYGRRRSATVAVQLQMIAERLQAFAEWQTGQVSKGWIIRHSEVTLEAEIEDSKGRPVRISGRIDRIDHNRQKGEWRVLDYKTGESRKRPQEVHYRKGEWVDLQLPLYRLLIEPLELKGSIWLGYVNLPGDLKYLGESMANWSEEQLQSAWQTAREIAAQILDLEFTAIRSTTGTMNDDYSRVCQDTVVGRQLPWLSHWPGRTSVNVDEPASTVTQT